MKKLLSTFRSLPVRTRQLLSIGLILALFVALPLFVWAVVTQRFELRKKAQEISVSSCTGQPDGTACVGGGCPSPLIGPNGEPIACTRPVWMGTCQNQVCGPTNPCGPDCGTPPPNPCLGQSDGTNCSVCPPNVCIPGREGEPGNCRPPGRPCRIGLCQSGQCAVGATPSPPPTWTIKAQAVCKDGTPANHVTRLYAWSGNPSDLKLRQDLEKGDTPTNSEHKYTWSPPSNYTFICWGMDGGTDVGNIKPVCSSTLGPIACSNNPYCSEGNYSTQRSDSLCNLNHTANPNLQEKFCWEGIASEWLQSSPPPYGDYVINFQAPDSWCGGICPSGDKGNLNCDTNGLINAIDLSILLSSWCVTSNCTINTPQNGRSPDLNGDGKVNALDLSILLSNWKPS